MLTNITTLTILIIINTNITIFSPFSVPPSQYYNQTQQHHHYHQHQQRQHWLFNHSENNTYTDTITAKTTISITIFPKSSPPSHTLFFTLQTLSTPSSFSFTPASPLTPPSTLQPHHHYRRHQPASSSSMAVPTGSSLSVAIQLRGGSVAWTTAVETPLDTLARATLTAVPPTRCAYETALRGRIIIIFISIITIMFFF